MLSDMKGNFTRNTFKPKGKTKGKADKSRRGGINIVYRGNPTPGSKSGSAIRVVKGRILPPA
jgi:hypothetical protein